jgi:hypothetical protein
MKKESSSTIIKSELKHEAPPKEKQNLIRVSENCSKRKDESGRSSVRRHARIAQKC